MGNVSPLVIKLNNFILYAGAGCVLPYMSVYYLHYTRASSADVGRVLLASSFLGMLLSLGLSSLADRRQAHRQVYLTSLTLAYLSFLVLFGPIIFRHHLEADHHHHHHHHHQNQDYNDEPASQEDFWFYVCGFCLALGSMTTTVSLNLSDSFSVNVARKGPPGVTFGSVRIFGSMGIIFASIMLILWDRLANLSGCIPRMAYLSPAFGLFALLATINILLIALWPDSRPFDLAEQAEKLALDDDEHQKTPDKIKFQSRRLLGLASRQAAKHASATSGDGRGLEPVAGHLFAFDSRHDEPHRNVRRCSLAPLGESHLIKQFELKHQHQEVAQASHFSFVTIIEPNATGGGGGGGGGGKALPVVDYNISFIGTVGEKSGATAKGAAAGPRAPEISLRCHLKVVQLIARRDKDMLRFMVLYAVVGFTVAMNWAYLFPYLESIDELKSRSLAPWALISGYLSETLFYRFGAPLMDLANHRVQSLGLSLVLFVLAARYSLYLVLVYWPLWAPMELVLLVELLQAASLGLFNCLINESALRFALQAKYCLPELRRLRLIEQDEPTPPPDDDDDDDDDDDKNDNNKQRESSQLNDRFKLTMVALLSCCFDGLGVAFGSLAGGWLIERFGFAVMWQTSIGLALSVATCNCLLELRSMLALRGRQAPPASKAPFADMPPATVCR